jgi:YD repeat-containing protein
MNLDGRGKTWAFDYDNRERRTSAKDPPNQVTTLGVARGIAAGTPQQVRVYSTFCASQAGTLAPPGKAGIGSLALQGPPSSLVEFSSGQQCPVVTRTARFMDANWNCTEAVGG